MIKPKFPLMIALFALAQPAFAADPTATAAEDTALDRLTMPEQQLRQFLLLVSAQTVPVKQSVLVSGVSGHCERFVPIFNSAVNANLPEWSANLRAAYRETVPAPILQDAIDAGAMKGAMLIAPYRNEIGKKMQGESTQLLQTAAVAMVGQLSEETPEVTPGSIDMKKGMEELQVAIADRSMFCDLAKPSGEGAARR